MSEVVEAAKAVKEAAVAVKDGAEATATGAATAANNLAETANGALQGLIEQAAKGADFVKEQIPDVLQQLLHWKLAEACVWGVFDIAMAGAAAWATKKCVDAMRKHNAWEASPVLAVFLVPFGVGLSKAAEQIATALQIWIAPKVWLIEYAASLVKHN